MTDATAIVVATRADEARACAAALVGAACEVLVAPVGDAAAALGDLPAGARVLGASADPVAALHAAVQASTGRICVVVDEAAVPAPSLVAAHVAAQSDRAHVGVGRTAIGDGAGWLVASHQRLVPIGGRFGLGLDGSLSAPRAALASPAVVDHLVDARPLLHAQLAQLLACDGLAVAAVDGATATRRDVPDDRQLEGALERIGRASHAAWRAQPAAIRALLGGFRPVTPRAAAIARVLLATGASPALPARLDRVLGRHDDARGWWQARAAHAFWRGVPRRDRARLLAGVPILMYHGFSPAGAEGSRWAIPADRFASHLRVLRLLRRRAITLAELVARWEAGDPPARAVVITIDDGYRTVGELAAPALAAARMPASLYVVTDLVGGSADWDADVLSGTPLLGVDALRELARAGWEIGPHTRTHARLTTLSDDDVRAEIDGSTAAVAGAIGPPRTFAYPFGAHDDRSVAATIALGLAACTTEHGRAWIGDDRARLPRIEVTGRTSAARVAQAVLIGRRCHER